MLTNYETYFLGTSVLMHDCQLDLFGLIILQFILRIENKAKLEILIHWSDSHIKTNPVLLFYFDQMLQIFRNFDGHLWKINPDNHLIVKAKLFCRLAKSCHHLENQKIYSVVFNYLFFLLLFEVNRVGNTTRTFDYFIYHIIPDRTILKTYNVNDWIWFNSVFQCQLLVQLFWCF